jgi:Leucine-rich repeat (LRR) protein
MDSVELRSGGNLEPLVSIRSLDTVIIDGNLEVSDVSPLGDLPFLREIRFSGLKKRHEELRVDGLSRLDRLEKIDLSDNQVRNIQFLNSQRYLKEVFARKNLITDISPLANEFCSLEILDIQENQVSKVSHVMSACKNLKSILVSRRYLAPSETTLCSTEAKPSVLTCF